MMRLLLTISMFLVAFLSVAGPASAQTTAGQTLPSGTPFVGESLTYEAKFNRILRGISIAEMTMTAGRHNEDGYRITADAVSKGTLLRMFRFSFLQNYVSELDGDFRILRTTKHDVQRQRVRDSEAVFDYEAGSVIYVETDPKDPMRPPRRIASDVGSAMLDMVAAIYHVRMQPLAVGKRFEIEVSDSGLVYKVPVVVTAREIQKTVLGNVQCFRVEPEIFGKDRLIEQKGKMIIWYTDDARRIPIRSTINAEVGKIDIKLKSVSKDGLTMPLPKK